MNTSPDEFTSAESVKTLTELIDRNLSLPVEKEEGTANAAFAG